MTQFEAVVYDRHGIRQTLTIGASDLQSAKRSLFESQYQIVSLKELESAGKRGLFAREKLSVDELEFFTAQMALLLKNGLRLDEALDLLRKVAVGPQLKMVLAQLHVGVREGRPLSEQMEARWGFDRLYINLMKIGESSGTIDNIFAGIAADLKFRKILAGKVKQAISYPLLVLFFSVAAILFVFNVVIPRMSMLFESQENLPWYTDAMLALAAGVQDYQWFAPPVLVALAFLLIQLKNYPRLKRSLDRFMISMPLLRSFTKLVSRIRYSSAMHLTLAAGISIEQAMSHSARVVNNEVLRLQVEAAQTKVRQGSSLADCFRQTLLFDDLHTGLIEVGEKSGDLEGIFAELTERDQFDFDALISRFTALLEPILILLMAAVVGGVVVVMLMSIIAVQDISF